MELTKDWQLLSTSRCLVQNLTAGAAPRILYSTKVPTPLDSYSKAFKLNTTEIVTLPKPASGGIYIQSNTTAIVVVQDL